MRVVELQGVAEGALATSASAGVHTLRLDEPLDLGGTDTGATPTEVLLAAQDSAIAFYERLGYLAEGPEFLDAGIVHRWMRKPL